MSEPTRIPARAADEFKLINTHNHAARSSKLTLPPNITLELHIRVISLHTNEEQDFSMLLDPNQLPCTPTVGYRVAGALSKTVQLDDKGTQIDIQLPIVLSRFPTGIHITAINTVTKEELWWASVPLPMPDSMASTSPTGAKCDNNLAQVRACGFVYDGPEIYLAQGVGLHVDGRITEKIITVQTTVQRVLYPASKEPMSILDWALRKFAIVADAAVFQVRNATKSTQTDPIAIGEEPNPFAIDEEETGRPLPPIYFTVHAVERSRAAPRLLHLPHRRSAPVRYLLFTDDDDQPVCMPCPATPVAEHEPDHREFIDLTADHEPQAQQQAF